MRVPIIEQRDGKIPVRLYSDRHGSYLKYDADAFARVYGRSFVLTYARICFNAYIADGHLFACHI